jgi:hypothetical protein
MWSLGTIKPKGLSFRPIVLLELVYWRRVAESYYLQKH